MSRDELVTVVIPARNEEKFVGSCLDSVLAQDYQNLQVVVVDGDSTDGTADVVRLRMHGDERVSLLYNNRRNIPSSLNLALEQARGTWLVRVDAHSTIPPTYVRLAVERLRENLWGGVGGRKDGVGRTPAGRAIAVAMSSKLGVGNSTYHWGTVTQEVDHLPFGAYPVNVVRGINGWDENLTANEDFEFDYRLRRAGFRLLFDPVLVIRWHCRQSVSDLFRQYFRYGRGKADVAFLHPESLSLRHLAPPLFVGYAVGALLIATKRPSWAAALVAPYVVAVGAESIRLAPRLDVMPERLRVPVAIVAMHIGWGLGFWSGLYTIVSAKILQGFATGRHSRG